MRSTFRILFLARWEIKKESGRVPLCVRITVDGEKVKFSLKANVSEKIWDPKAGRLIGYEDLIVWSSAKPAFIARMLEAGFHPIAVAQYAGVSVDIVYKYCPGQPREKDTLGQMNRAFNVSKS